MPNQTMSNLQRAMEDCPILSPGRFSLPSKTIFVIINTMATLLAIGGNSLVMGTLYQYPSLRRRSNLLLLGLAITDLSVGVFVQPLASAEVISAALDDNCSLSYFVTYIAAGLCGASAWLLCLISYDRYLHLSKLTNYSKFMTARKLKLLVFLCWFYPSLVGCLMFSERTLNAYYIVLIASAFATMSIIFGCYFMSWKIVKAKSMKMTTEKRKSREVSRHWKVAKSVAIIIFCYTLSWLPMTMFVVFYLVFRLKPFNAGLLGEYGTTIYYFTLLLGFTNSCINPALYYWRNGDLREGMTRFFNSNILRRKVSTQPIEGSDEQESSNMEQVQTLKLQRKGNTIK